jgi:hypothetical protein
MQMLRCRSEDQFDGQSQYISGKNGGHHFWVTPHMPNPERSARRWLSGQLNGLSQGHSINAIGHACATKSQLPLLGLQRHQSIDGRGNTCVALFEVENDDFRIIVKNKIRVVHEQAPIVFNAPKHPPVHPA